MSKNINFVVDIINQYLIEGKSKSYSQSGSVTASPLIVYHITGFDAKMVYLFIKRGLLKKYRSNYVLG